MTPKGPFLLRMLAIIFGVQALFMAYGISQCEKLERCDQAANRAEELFNVAIATTLSLLAADRVVPEKPPTRSRPKPEDRS